MGSVLNRVWEDLVGRSDGPLTIRLIVQPTIPVLVAIRAGFRDARTGQSPFLWTVFSSPGQCRELIRQARNDLSCVFTVAIVLDSIYQVIVHSTIYPLELLLTATILAVVPYAIVRGLVTRLARRLPRVRLAEDPPGNQATYRECPPQERQDF